jgi:hypothetical protein
LAGGVQPPRPEADPHRRVDVLRAEAGLRAEVVSVSETFSTPAGEFRNCLRTKESTKLKTLLFFSPTEYKTYAPGIGLIQDQDMKLVRHGFLERGGAAE